MNSLDCSKLKTIIDSSIYSELKDLKTKDNYSFSDVIELTNSQNEQNSIMVPSPEIYKKFSKYFDRFLSIIHDQNIKQEKFEKESYSMLKSLLINFDEIMDSYFIDCTIETKRNFDKFNFPCNMSLKERNEIQNKIKAFIQKNELAIFKSKGEFKEILNDKIKDNLNKERILEDFPKNYQIYLNEKNDFKLIINLQDHLNIILENKNKGNLANKLLNYFVFLEFLEKENAFAYEDYYGYLNTNPYDLGSGTHILVNIKLNVSKEALAKIKDTLNNSKNDISYSISEDETILTLKNKTPFNNFSNFIVEILSLKEFLQS